MLKFNLSKPQVFLCLCVRHCDYIDSERISVLYAELGDDVCYEEANLNGVAAIVAHALILVFGEANIPTRWVEEYTLVNDRISSYMVELERIAALLKKHEILLLALKNSGITIGMYPFYGACPMGDVDVLVSKDVFRQAHGVLSDAGYTLKFRSPLEEDNIEAAEHGGGAEYSVVLEGGEHLWFELQWRPVAGRWIQPEQEPKAKDLIARSVAITDSDVRLLSPEDNLLQVALHTAKHSFVRAPGFRLHTDVDRIVTTQIINWDVFVDRVVELKVKTPVFMSLAMAEALLGTDISSDVLERIHPGNFKVALLCKWIERVGVFEPDAPKWSSLGYIVFVSCLYDDFFDFWRGIFPSSDELKRQYGFSKGAYLPYFYLKRMVNLIFSRVKI